MHRLGTATSIGAAARSRPGDLQGRGPAAQGGVVRHGEIKPKQADDRANQPFGLPVRQAEHSPERQSRQDGEFRVPGLPASGGARLSPPGRDGLLADPDRQTAALTQASVIGGPVRDLAPLPGNVVASVLVQLERQGGHPRSDEGCRPTPPRPQHQPPSRSMQHSLVRDIRTNKPQAIHRTALSWSATKWTVNGKDRLALGPIAGGAVKLTPDEDVTTCLGIGEGIETTLSLRLVPEFGPSPVWALLSAGGIEHFPVLSGIECLWIAVDHDANGRGQAAAQACADRWHAAGREVHLITPKTKGADLNDLARRGRNA